MIAKLIALITNTEQMAEGAWRKLRSMLDVVAIGQLYPVHDVLQTVAADLSKALAMLEEKKRSDDFANRHIAAAKDILLSMGADVRLGSPTPPVDDIIAAMYRAVDELDEAQNIISPLEELATPRLTDEGRHPITGRLPLFNEQVEIDPVTGHRKIRPVINPEAVKEAMNPDAPMFVAPASPAIPSGEPSPRVRTAIALERIADVLEKWDEVLFPAIGRIEQDNPATWPIKGLVANIYGAISNIAQRR